MHEELDTLIYHLLHGGGMPLSSKKVTCDLPEYGQMRNIQFSHLLPVYTVTLYFCCEEHKNIALKRWGIA